VFPRNHTFIAAILSIALIACASSDDTSNSDAAASTSASGDAAPSTPTSETNGTVATTDTTGVAVFDPAVMHTISVEFAQDDYDAMIATFEESGDGTDFLGDLPGGTLPEGAEPPRGGGFGRANPLVERFLANEEFNALYEARLAELTGQLVVSGDANSVLDAWVDMLQTQAGDLVATDVVESEAATIREFLADRATD
jgi:spore coat protein CotH